VTDPVVPQDLCDFLESSPVPLSLAASEADHPLVFVNARFVELTGYAPADILGHNCRLLQRGVEDRQAHAKMRAFLHNDSAAPMRAPVINFRKDGTAFVNLLHLSRLRALTGETRYILASQFDVSRAQPDRLAAHDLHLVQALTDLGPLAAECGIVVERTLSTIADSMRAIAQAKLALTALDWDTPVRR
jgi:PAS domain S-box-containing protein